MALSETFTIKRICVLSFPFLLIAGLAYLSRGEPSQIISSNDMPLGIIVADWHAVENQGAMGWQDLNWLGSASPPSGASMGGLRVLGGLPILYILSLLAVASYCSWYELFYPTPEWVVRTIFITYAVLFVVWMFALAALFICGLFLPGWQMEQAHSIVFYALHITLLVAVPVFTAFDPGPKELANATCWKCGRAAACTMSKEECRTHEKNKQKT